ncbi:MAG: hypothetical protein K0S70_4723, partial [Microbacterium sp.]|nr:hypothetical protein [Microbacterium sp.]
TDEGWAKPSTPEQSWDALQSGGASYGDDTPF